MKPEVSIVIIVFNDSELLSQSIKSAQRQTLSNVEIIVVDHGSTDGSADVAAEFARNDDRVKLIRLPDNDGGPGRPLNAGIDAATADWVTVMGSDDELVEDASRYLLTAGKLRKVDVVLGRAERIDVHTGQRRAWFGRLFQTERRINVIHDEPEIMSDTISAAKLYKTAFLRSNGIRFPEDIVYEDQIFTIRVYLLAQGIYVLPETVYHWMVRPKAASRSITNSRDQVQNFIDRIEVNKRIDSLLAVQGDQVLIRAKNKKFITHDLNLYFNGLAERDESYKSVFTECVGDYLTTITINDVEDIPPLTRAIVGFLKERNLAMALATWEFRLNDGPIPVPLERVDNRIFWGSSHLDHDIESSWFEVTELGLHLLPYSKRRLRVTTNELSSRGTDLIVNVSLAELAGSLSAGIDNAVFVLKNRRTGATIETLGECTRSAQSQEIEVKATITPTRSFPRTAHFKEYWDLWIHTTIGSERNVARVPAPGPKLEAVRVRLSGPLPRLGGDVLDGHITERGNFSLRLHQSNRLMAAIAWRLAKTRRVSTTWIGKAAKAEKVNQRLIPIKNRISQFIFRIASGLPRRDYVFFESFRGRQCSDSPLAISEELYRVHPDIGQIWSYSNMRAMNDIPSYSTKVKRGSWSYFYAIGRAKYWVDNFGIDPELAKPEQTVYLQTWHGTPIKRLFFDSPKVRKASVSAQDKYKSANRRWDLLVSQSQYYNDTLASGSMTEAEILMTGLPRNDYLAKAGILDVKTLRKSLAVTPERRVALYMPTYRDPKDHNNQFVELAGDDVARELQNDWLLLSRQHYYRRAAKVGSAQAAFLRDVSTYSRVEELMVASDLLISDFSSAIFDYSILKKPIIFYVPDLDFYQKVSPKTYIDLKSIAPGPIAETKEEVVELLKAFDDWKFDYVDDLENFRQSFAPYDDGSAAQRVVERVWGS